MQLHSLIVSEPAGVVTGFGVGLLTYALAGFCGAAPHTSLIAGCIAHFIANTVIAGHVNLLLLDFLALVMVRVPAAAGSTLWMSHMINTGHLF